MKTQSTPTLAAVDQPRLILCRVFDKRNRLVKRWAKPSTPVLIPCTKCGFMDTAFAADAPAHVCLDCASCEAENVAASDHPPKSEQES